MGRVFVSSSGLVGPSIPEGIKPKLSTKVCWNKSREVKNTYWYVVTGIVKLPFVITSGASPVFVYRTIILSTFPLSSSSGRGLFTCQITSTLIEVVI